MRNRRRKSNAARAFTLIEVLLAVAVFAIVLGAINSVFFGALRLRNKTTEILEAAVPLQHALTIIQHDLEGMLPPGGRFAGTFTTTVEGMSNNVAFIGERLTPDIYTTSGSVSDSARWSDAQKVAYFLALPMNSARATISDGKDLVRQVTGNLLPVTVEEPEVQWLMSGVQTMALQYYDGLVWSDTWIYTNLPSAIKVQITLAADYTSNTKAPAPIELIVPVMVQASTNSTQNGGAE
jgi:prepilin-type N-terminal cleavage/methylation domain-containing protein